MTERIRQRSRSARFAPLLLVVLLGAAAFLRPGDDGGALLLANPDRTRVTELQAALGALPDSPLVLVGLDADLGTYPEIRVAVRAAIADLLARDARLAFVSFTPEGRAIASAELDRLRRDGVGEAELLDLGFIAGSEAGMVRAVTDVLPAGVEGSLADAIREADGGMAAFSFVLVVGGGELGPRTWVEQVGIRLPSLPIAAIVPTFAQPELAPYLRTGQLVALLATLRDGAAYAADVGGNAQAAPERVPSALAMLLGMLVVLGALARTVAAGLRGGTPGPGDGMDAARRRRSEGTTDRRGPSDAGQLEAEAASDAEAPTGEAAPKETEATGAGGEVATSSEAPPAGEPERPEADEPEGDVR